MIRKIINPLIVGSFDTNINQSSCLMDSPSSQLDPYTPPNDYQISTHPTNPPNIPNLNWS
jgi:hypothetical protein